MSAGSANHDVVVIGAGIGGLACAAFLARAGARVAVLEQAETVGGCFASFDVKGFRFDAGIRAIENAGVLLPVLRMLGIEEEAALVPDPVGLGIENEVVPLSSDADLAEWFEAVARRHAGERPALQAIHRDALEVSARMAGVFEGENPLFLDRGNRAAMLKALKWTLANRGTFRRMNDPRTLLGMTFREYLASRTSSAPLARLLAHAYPVDAPVHFCLGYSRLFRDYRYPRGGMSAIPALLARLVESLGGEVRRGAAVERILVEGGRAAGVGLAGGGELRAAAVVHAGDLRRLWGRMLPPEVLDPRRRALLAAAATTESVFSVFAAVDAPPEAVCPWGVGHIIYLPNPDGADHAQMRSSPEWFSRASIEISVPCLRDPALAPNGKTGICLGVAASAEYAGGWGGSDRAAYETLKRNAADRVLASAARLMPVLRDRLLFCLAATPCTFERHTLNTGGAIMGWRHSRDDPVVPQNFFRFPQGRSGDRSPASSSAATGPSAPVEPR